MSKAQSPLHHAELNRLANPQEKGGVHLRERAFQGYLNLRCDQNSNEHKATIEKVLGIPLAINPLNSTDSEDYSIQWMSSDE